ncbi:hypothetical protein Pelo_15749 [Pelomyxa schiedti]|nr:hypothetical protein Pelo_15749 [Pelomyxa schiedti]
MALQTLSAEPNVQVPPPHKKSRHNKQLPRPQRQVQVPPPPQPPTSTTTSTTSTATVPVPAPQQQPISAPEKKKSKHRRSRTGTPAHPVVMPAPNVGGVQPVYPQQVRGSSQPGLQAST